MKRFLAWPWLPLLVVLPFVFLFLMTALPRLWTPFSLEWIEDQMCEQALRFAQGKALYPRLESEWVPYRYAPFYHMTLGAIFALTGNYHVGWGRLISLVSTLATAAGIGFIIFDRSRQWSTAFIAGLLYFAFFKPTGYWYDIARVDAYAFAFATWGMYFTLKRNPSTVQIIVGVFLLCLGTLTKQPIAAVLIVSVAWVLLTQFRAARLAIALMTFVFVNALLLFQAAGNDNLFRYTIDMALHGATNPGVLMPRHQDPDQFMRTLPDPKSRAHAIQEYVRQSASDPPQIWTGAGQYVWMLIALVALWLVLSVVRLQWPSGIVYLIPVVLLGWGGIVSFAGIGGYNNTLLPVFLGVTVLTGFAIDGIRRAFPERRSAILSALFALVLFAQIYQPWALPRNSGQDVADPEGRQKAVEATELGRYQMFGAERDPKTKKDLGDYLFYLDQRARRLPAVDPSSVATRMRYQLGRWTVAGLAWVPSYQQPAPGSSKVYDDFMRWLVVKKQRNESVWIIHHQWFAILAGFPPELNVDAIREANYQGVPIPARALQALNSRQYKWLVLDMGELQSEWLPAGFMNAIQANYDPLGPLPAYRGVDSAALLPVTGAMVRPYTLYRAKGFDGTAELY